MIDLKDVLVVTGSIHIEGGKQISTKSEVRPGQRRGADRLTVTQEKVISGARREADVIATNVSRRLRKLRLLHTNFGTLIAPENAKALRALMIDVTRMVAAFNRDGRDVRIENCYVVEPLAGSRLTGLQGWIERRIKLGDVEVKAAVAGVPKTPSR